MENTSKIESKTSAIKIVEVSAKESTVCCRGGDNALGHPAVYLEFSDQDTVQCYYCGCIYKRV